MINSEEIDSFKSNISELLNVVLYEVCQNLQLNLRLETVVSWNCSHYCQLSVSQD